MASRASARRNDRRAIRVAVTDAVAHPVPSAIHPGAAPASGLVSRTRPTGAIQGLQPETAHSARGSEPQAWLATRCQGWRETAERYTAKMAAKRTVAPVAAPASHTLVRTRRLAAGARCIAALPTSTAAASQPPPPAARAAPWRKVAKSGCPPGRQTAEVKPMIRPVTGERW